MCIQWAAPLKADQLTADPTLHKFAVILHFERNQLGYVIGILEIVQTASRIYFYVFGITLLLAISAYCRNLPRVHTLRLPLELVLF